MKKFEKSPQSPQHPKKIEISTTFPNNTQNKEKLEKLVKD
jgi:hypothetical protein